MATPTGTAPAIPELALIERSIGYTRVSLATAARTPPTVPTPCRGWDLRALLDHMVESMVTLEEAGRAGSIDLAVPPTPPHPVADATLTGVVGELSTRACDLMGAWSSGDRLVSVAGSPLRAGVLAAAGALEIAVHGWDVAQACGCDHPLPEPLAADLLAYLPLLVQRGDRPSRFAPPLRVPESAPPSVRLLGALGRRASESEDERSGCGAGRGRH